jgi:prepilin peptidase CpaA
MGLKQGLLGALLGGGIFFLFFVVGGMGGGDVKLMAAVSGWAGIHGTLTMLIATALAGGMLALAYMFFNKQVVNTMRNLGALLRFHLTSGIRPHPKLNLRDPKTVRLPYGVAIAVGALYLLLSASNLAGVIYGH